MLLVDTSASMQREDLWQQAVDHVEQQLADFQPGDEIALLSFDRSVNSLIDFEEVGRLEYAERVVAVRTSLENVSPGSDATDLGMALVATSDMLQRAKENTSANGALPPTIVLITDLQQGSRLNRLDGYEWPQEIRVDVRTVAVAAPTNATAVVMQRSKESDAQDDELQVRVYNAANSTSRQFRIGWAFDKEQSGDEGDYAGGIVVPGGPELGHAVLVPKR